GDSGPHHVCGEPTPKVARSSRASSLRINVRRSAARSAVSDSEVPISPNSAALRLAFPLLCVGPPRQFRPANEDRIEDRKMAKWNQETRAKSLIARSSIVTQCLAQHAGHVGPEAYGVLQALESKAVTAG